MPTPTPRSAPPPASPATSAAPARPRSAGARTARTGCGVSGPVAPGLPGPSSPRPGPAPSPATEHRRELTVARPTAPRVDAAERDAAALDLRAAGLSIRQEIGRAAG